MQARKIGTIACIVLLVVAAGCAGFGDEGQVTNLEGGDGDGDAGGAQDGSAAQPEADAEAQAGDPDAPPGERQLIRTGEMRLEVDDATAASAAVREVTDHHRGFVSDSSRRVHGTDNETWQTETVVVRVPSGSFNAAFGELEELGEVQRAETATDDVTEQLVDLDARLENLEVQRDRLRTLYDEANETQDVLAVQRELSDVQEEIERLEAQKQRLEGDVAYATITVHLAEPKPEPETEVAPAWHETPVTAAFAESVDAVVVTVRALVVAAAYVAPFVLAFGTPLVGAAAVYRYRAR